MPASSRENAIGALKSLVAAAYVWKSGPARRLKLWNDVSLSARPACYLFEGGEDVYSWTETARPKRIIEVRLFIYLSAKDGNVVGAALLNEVMDALDAAFVPKGADELAGRNTLGGAAYHCLIEGKVLKDPGDLDGDALLVVPVKIVLP
jgi:hypothetical protein